MKRRVGTSALVLYAGLSLVLQASLSAGSAAGAADAQLKSLRHLVFDVTYNSESNIETKVSGFDHGSDSGLVNEAGPVEDRKGAVSVDVIAATADGGLAVDISENGAAPSRVGITSASLFYSRDAPVTDEERALLHYLARDFVKADTLSQGTTWTETNSDGAAGQTTYTVRSVDADAHMMTVDILGSGSAQGSKSFIETTTGSLVYDTDKVVPVSFDISIRTVVDRDGRTNTVVSHIASRLSGDSFAKKAP